MRHTYRCHDCKRHEAILADADTHWGEDTVSDWTPVEEKELREALATVYTAEGIDIWLADARKKKLSFQECMMRIIALQEGTFI